MKTEELQLSHKEPNGTESNETVIEISDLCKSFGTQNVLKNFSMKLYNGENLVILGKSGSGKSVLVK